VIEERIKDEFMATSTTPSFSTQVPEPAILASALRTDRRRRINPQAGHALEILGHAIEYLTDEFVHEGGSFSAHNAQIEAVQLLMACNRAVYFACPVIPDFRERWGMFLRRHHAS
jgi:hypothetical protein